MTNIIVIIISIISIIIIIITIGRASTEALAARRSAAGDAVRSFLLQHPTGQNITRQNIARNYFLKSTNSVVFIPGVQ